MDTFVKMLEASSASAFWTMSTATSCIEQVIAVINFMTFACAGKKNIESLSHKLNISADYAG